MLDTAKPTIFQNIAAQMVSQAGVVFAQLAYVVIVARSLDLHSFGIFSLAVSVSQIVLVVSDLGLNLVLARQLAAHPSAGQTFFRQILSLKIAFALLFGILTAVGSWLWLDSEASKIVAIFAAGIVVHSIAISFNMAFQGYGLLHIASLTTFLLAVLQLTLGAGFLILGGKLISLGIAYVVAAFTILLLNYFFFFRKTIHKIVFQFEIKSGLFHLKQSFPLGLAAAFNSIANRSDVALLFYLAGAAEVGIYAGAYRITGTLYNIPVAIFAAILPFLSRISWRTPDMDDILERSLLIAALGGSALFLFFTVAGTQVEVSLFGETYRAAGDILRILSCALVPAFINVGLLHASVSQRSTAKVYTVAAGAGAVVNILLNLSWIPMFKSRGAAYATVVTELIVFATYLFLLRQKIWFTRLGRPMRALALGISAGLIAWFTSIQGWINASLVVTAYLLVTLWIGQFSQEDWKFWSQRFLPTTSAQ